MSIMDLKILFKDPNARLQDEMRSKLIKPDCELYNRLDKLRYGYLTLYGLESVAPRRMDYHIELIKTKEEARDENLLVKRCQKLEGVVLNELELCKMGKAIVLKTPYVEGYGITHITVAYFPDGVPEGLGLSSLHE